MKHTVRKVEIPEPILGRKIPDNFALPELYPFGCLVDFLPSLIFLRKFPKWGSKAQPGVLLSYNTRPGGVWNKEYVVAMLADFQSGASRPQIHTVREIVVGKENGAFIFPLKENYEKARVTIEQPAESDDDDATERVEKAFEELEAALEETEFDVPPESQSDNKNDASSTNKLPHEAKGPTETGGDTTSGAAPDVIADPSSSTKQTKPSDQDKTTHVGTTEAFGMTTRNYRGSQRPPDIPGVVWATFPKKAREEAIANYKEHGYGLWPRVDAGKISPLLSSTTADSDITNLFRFVPICQLYNLNPATQKYILHIGTPYRTLRLSFVYVSRDQSTKRKPPLPPRRWLLWTKSGRNSKTKLHGSLIRSANGKTYQPRPSPKTVPFMLAEYLVSWWKKDLNCQRVTPNVSSRAAWYSKAIKFETSLETGRYSKSYPAHRLRWRLVKQWTLMVALVVTLASKPMEHPHIPKLY